jgi:hypothetical protein
LLLLKPWRKEKRTNFFTALSYVLFLCIKMLVVSVYLVVIHYRNFILLLRMVLGALYKGAAWLSGT